MPAEEKEVKDAINEGVKLLYQTNITKIIGKDKVEKIECVPTKLVKKEESKKEIPINIEGEEYILPMDIVVMAIGAKPEINILESLDIELTAKGCIKINDKYQTNKEKYFSGGDVTGEKQTVAWAARSGREAGEEINKYLKEKRKI